MGGGLYVLQSIFAFICCTAIWHVVIVLFGAPFFSSVVETLLLAGIVSSVTCLPFCCIYENWDQIARIIFDLKCNNRGELLALRVIQVAVFGLWLGAIPIPLDWDRPWQKWPITCVVGVVCGSIAGLFIGLIEASIRYPKRSAKRKIV